MEMTNGAEITISGHAAEMAALRGITVEGIMAILAESPLVTIPSKYDLEAVVIFGKYADRIWAIVFNYRTLNVITVRRARKKEEKFYEQEKEN